MYKLPPKEKLLFAKDRRPAFDALLMNRSLDDIKAFFSYGYSPNETFDLGLFPNDEEKHQGSYLSMVLWRKYMTIYESETDRADHLFEDTVIGHLLSSGLDFKSLNKTRNSFSSPLLALLSKFQIKSFLEKGLSVNHIDDEGFGLLAALCAIEEPGRQKFVESKIALLLDKGADPNKFDTDFQNPLRIAVETCFPEAVELLCNHNAFVEIIDSEGADLKAISYSRMQAAIASEPHLVSGAQKVHAFITRALSKKGFS